MLQHAYLDTEFVSYVPVFLKTALGFECSHTSLLYPSAKSGV